MNNSCLCISLKNVTNDQWYYICSCGCVSGVGQAVGKIKAKKRAAYMTLVFAYLCRRHLQGRMTGRSVGRDRVVRNFGSRG